MLSHHRHMICSALFAMPAVRALDATFSAVPRPRAAQTLRLRSSTCSRCNAVCDHSTHPTVVLRSSRPSPPDTSRAGTLGYERTRSIVGLSNISGEMAANPILPTPIRFGIAARFRRGRAVQAQPLHGAELILSPGPENGRDENRAKCVNTPTGQPPVRLAANRVRLRSASRCITARRRATESLDRTQVLGCICLLRAYLNTVSHDRHHRRSNHLTMSFECALAWNSLDRSKARV